MNQPDEEPGVGGDPDQSEDDGQDEHEAEAGTGGRRCERSWQRETSRSLGDQNYLNQEEDTSSCQSTVQPS